MSPETDRLLQLLLKITLTIMVVGGALAVIGVMLVLMLYIAGGPSVHFG